MSDLIIAFNKLVEDNLPGAIALAFVVYIVTQFILAHFRRKSDRRGYRYKRSAAIGEMRFDKEAYHIEKTSEAVLLLVEETCRLTSTNSQSKVKKGLAKKWQKCFHYCVKALGAAAPFLNYVDSETGKQYCGVKIYSRSCETEIKHDSADSSSQDRCAISLYSRAVDIVNKCLCLAKESNLVNSEIDYSGLPTGLIGERHCHTPENLKNEYLVFLECAQCRLKDCETGTKDARRQHFKRWRTRWLSKLFSGTLSYFDNRCPSDDMANENGLLDSLDFGEFVRVFFVSSVITFSICWLFVRIVYTYSLLKFDLSFLVGVSIITLVLFATSFFARIACKCKKGKSLGVKVDKKTHEAENAGKERLKDGSKRHSCYTLIMTAVLIVSVITASLTAILIPSPRNIDFEVVRQTVTERLPEELSQISEQVSSSLTDLEVMEIAEGNNLFTSKDKFVNVTQEKLLKLSNGNYVFVQIINSWNDDKTGDEYDCTSGYKQKE